jgi:hypothetical protein
VLRWRFFPWSEDMWSIFRAYGGGLPGGDDECPALISGAIRSPSTSGALAMPSEQPKRLSVVDLTFVRGHAIVRAPVPRGAPSAAATPGTSRTRCPARGFSPPRSRFPLSEASARGLRSAAGLNPLRADTMTSSVE